LQFQRDLVFDESTHLTIARQDLYQRTVRLGYAELLHSHLATRFQNAYGSKGFRKRHGEVRVLVVSTEDGLKGAGKSQERAAEGFAAMSIRMFLS
jgi:hypothetical protein